MKQGGTYFIYADANDAAGTTGTHVVTTVTANVANVTTGMTAVPLVAGSFTVGGVTYGYRSASITATRRSALDSKTYTVTATDASGNTGTLSGSVTVDNTVPTASDIETANHGQQTRQAQATDTITYTFNELIDPNSIFGGWDGTSMLVTLRLNDGGGGNDTITIFNSANTTQLPFGTVNQEDRLRHGECEVQ